MRHRFRKPVTTRQPVETMAYTDSNRPFFPLAVLTSLLCTILAACGGGEPVEAPAEGGGSTVRIASEPPPAPTRTTALKPGHLALDVAAGELAEVTRDWGAAHEAIPAGVPPGYDWRERSRRHAGLAVPSGFAAYTGWAQAFWASGAQVGTQRLELRQMQALLCLQTSAGPVWQRVQQGSIEGASFRADFAGDVNMPAELSTPEPGTLRVGFG
ncbi:MAG: hypothetical protein RL227_1891, partial [Pseudomonadota bacterium]